MTLNFQFKLNAVTSLEFERKAHVQLCLCDRIRKELSEAGLDTLNISMAASRDKWCQRIPRQLAESVISFGQLPLDNSSRFGYPVFLLQAQLPSAVLLEQRALPWRWQIWRRC